MDNAKLISEYGLPLEVELSTQIYNALQGNVVEEIIKMAKIPFSDNYYRSMLEGHSFKVEEGTLSRYYNIFNEIKETLQFTEPVDFYITGDPSVNAFAIASQEEGEPNIINVNSSLIQLMTDDELRFVIGHEMGHLINKNATLVKLINFVFPHGATIPITLQYKIRLWQQLSELVADRFGYMAMPNLNVCISAFFKMSSGLDFNKMDMKVEAFLEDNKKRLEYFRNDKGINFATHPINPIRVEALNQFSKSVFFNEKGTSKEDLENGMNDLIEILLKVRNTELDSNMAKFIATAGLIIANCDETISENEIDLIFSELSVLEIFPKTYLEDIAQSDVVETFKESIKKLLELNPETREAMLRYLISIALADKDINVKEVELIFNIAAGELGYSPMETAQIFSQMIQIDFTPSMNALC
ncbi:MAG: M48 family metalloprotease [Bacteroidales bacterium]|nr:M48 family metalloprotease [Bacteroidales bacterium]